MLGKDAADHVAQRGLQRGPTRERRLERARGLGQAIRINLPDRSIDGIFHALDGEGRLVLKRDGGVLETHSAGDVFLLGEDTAGLICDKAR